MLIGKPLERQMERWEDNVEMNLIKIGCEDANWIELAQDRVQ
jgi:hypothetical protein